MKYISSSIQIANASSDEALFKLSFKEIMVFIQIADEFFPLNYIAQLTGLPTETLLEYVNRGLFGVRKDDFDQLSQRYGDESLMEELKQVINIEQQVHTIDL